MFGLGLLGANLTACDKPVYEIPTEPTAQEEILTCDVDCTAVVEKCCDLDNFPNSCNMTEIAACDFKSIDEMEGCTVTDVFDWTDDGIDGTDCTQVIGIVNNVAEINECSPVATNTVREVACRNNNSQNYPGFVSFDIDDVINCE